MDLREVNLILRRHGRSWLWPWLCRCGGRYPCPCRRLGESEVRIHADGGRADAARRNASRLADGDQVPVPGHERYADLLRPAPRPPAVGQASLVRPYLDGRHPR